jgi:hypothetical protein
MDWVLVQLSIQTFKSERSAIVQNLHAQGVAVSSIKPVMNPKQLVTFLKKVNHLNHDRRRELVDWDTHFTARKQENVPGITEHRFQLPSNRYGHGRRFDLTCPYALHYARSERQALAYIHLCRQQRTREK